VDGSGSTAGSPVRADLDQHHALGVVRLAEVHLLDAAGVPDVRRPDRLRLVDVPEGDVVELLRQLRPLHHDVFLLGEAEQARADLRAVHMDMGREHGGCLRVVLRVGANVAEGVRPGGGQQPVLLVRAAVPQGVLAVQVAARRRVRHQHELHVVPAHAVLQADERGVGGEVQAAGRDALAVLADRRGGEGHRVNERLTEVLVVVVAGEGEDGAAGFEELAEHLLPVADGLAEAVRPGQLAEQVAGDEQHVGPLVLAVLGNALDGPAQVVGAVDPAEAVAEVPVRGVEDFHYPCIVPGFGWPRKVR
jgi:hypothetical protein